MVSYFEARKLRIMEINLDVERVVEVFLQYPNVIFNKERVWKSLDIPYFYVEIAEDQDHCVVFRLMISYWQYKTDGNPENYATLSVQTRLNCLLVS
jgi:hypothetical protein